MKDEALDELREMRRLASARFDHDLDRYVVHLQEMEHRHPGQIQRAEDLWQERQAAPESMILREEPGK